MDIAELLTFSVKNGASDLHLSAGLPPMIRVDGERKKIPVQRWYYKTGNRSLEHVVVIHGERIAAIEVGGRRPVRAGVRVPP